MIDGPTHGVWDHNQVTLMYCRGRSTGRSNPFLHSWSHKLGTCIYKCIGGTTYWVNLSFIPIRSLWPILTAKWSTRLLVSNEFSRLFTWGQFLPAGIVAVWVSTPNLSVLQTRHPFKLGSRNLDQRCKTLWLRSLLFWEVIDLDLQGQI